MKTASPKIFLHSKLIALSLLLIVVAWPLLAQEAGGDGNGQVEIPLDLYNQLVESSRPTEPPRPAPARFALGNATMRAKVWTEPKPGAEITMTLPVKVMEKGWNLVPILPAGTAVSRVVADGVEVQLVTHRGDLAWAIDRQGTFKVELTYRVDGQRVAKGGSLAVPTPEAASIDLTATWSGGGLDVAVIPAAGTKISSGGSTQVKATVPTTRGVQISWRSPVEEGYSLSRARYRGNLVGDAVIWRGLYDVEVWADGTVTLPLLDSALTVSNLLVDGKEAPILDKGQFSTLLEGRGRHQVQIDFEVLVDRQQGPPKIDMFLPSVPVSQLELTLPGKKEVSVTPASHVAQVVRNDQTVATVNVSLATEVTMSWTEAVPDEIKAEVRANAGVYHLAHAEEGVLYVRALVDYEVSRGETSQLRLAVPPDVQVNRVEEASGAVADWRLAREGDQQEIRVFLNRQLQGSLQLDIAYDRSLAVAEREAASTGAASGGTTSGGVAAETFEIPLLRTLDTQRQRGMVALLQSQDLTLEPVADRGATRVGENQLPAFVRQLSGLNVAHTFKYVETPPEIEARAATPERQQGRFDARVDTLLSLGEVTLKGASSIEIDVKSGHIMALDLDLPAGVNLLALSGPSLRDHEVEADAEGKQQVHLEFTQEMAGQFRLEAAFERLLADDEPVIEVPTIGVQGAEVEQGRLALEALSAVEVGVEAAEQLTTLDINELPQQLVLRTTNPILMAYKYVSPPYRLALRITHHDLVDVQEAAIDDAQYRTLFTRDGLSVTTASFQVRNSSEQFLRVKLPKGSQVWSAFVDGQSVKPALSSDEDGEWHLIKIIHSTRGFPVELIYQTEAGPIQGLGTVAARLPRPEILVTRTRWDVYVPDGVRYGQPSGELDLVSQSGNVSAAEVQQEMVDMADGASQQGLEPLRLVVPTAGMHFAFEKLYANQGDRDAGFVLPYASGSGRTLGSLVLILGLALLIYGVVLLSKGQRRNGLISAAIGLVIIVVMVWRYQVSSTPAFILGGLALSLILGYRWWRRRLAEEG